mmetsp:Transcript_23578/g.51256  ORF Transcript_23578/g.51256 Transcript_23578/m.51256 type:complete len:259 (+) Transcript_23578:275-1051(+)
MQAWVIGVVLSICAALCSALGDNLVKYSFKTEALERALYRRPAWVGGMVCIILLNTALNLASYAFADASITIPFGGLHICFNIPFAFYLNEERCSFRALACNLVILLGVMFCLLFGNHDSEFHTTSELFSMLFAPLFVVCTCLLAGLFAFVFSLIQSEKHSQQRMGMTVLCGLLGSITQVCAKTMSESLKDGAWTSLFTWLAIMCTIFFAVSQVYVLNICLDRYAAFFCGTNRKLYVNCRWVYLCRCFLSRGVSLGYF